MRFRTKLIIAVSISVVVLFGIVFMLVEGDRGPREPVASPSPPEIAERAEPVPPAPLVETLPAQESLEKERTPAREEPRTFRPLLKVGGWKLKGRIVAFREEDLGAAGPNLPNATPLAGVRVRLKPHPRRISDNPIAVHERVTGADGLFEYSGVPGDAYLRLEIDEPSSAFRTLSFRFGDPDAEGLKDLGDVPVEPGTTLTFRVQGPDGEAVDKATVLVTTTSSNPRRSQHLRSIGVSESRQRAEEKEGGIYVLERAARGEMYTQVKAPGYSPSGRVNFVSPQDEPLVVTLDPGHSIAGVVLDLDDKPIVSAELAAGAPGIPDRVKTDEEGRFLFDGLAAGNHTVRVKRDGYVDGREPNVPTGTEDLTFRLAPEAIVRGKVLAPDGGEPVPQAKVTLREKTTRSAYRADSGEDGSFEIRSVPAGTFTVTVDHETFASRSLEEALALETGERRDVGSILLAEGLGATGRIVEVDTAVPVPEADVTFALQGAGQSGIANRKASSDANGAYAVQGLSEGPYVVTVKAKGYVDGVPRTVTVAEDSERVFEFALELGSAIEGKVVDADGKPIAGAEVRPNVAVTPPGNFPEREKFNNIYNIRVQTDEEGRYRLEGLRPYPSYTVEATHSSYAGAKVRKIDLRPRSTSTDVDLTLRVGGSVSGRVIDAERRGLADVNVTASLRRDYSSGEYEWMSYGTDNRSARTDEEGRYTLNHLAEGTYTVQATSGELSPARRDDVQVQDKRETAGIDLQLLEGIALTGRVIDEDGNPVVGARIWIYDQDSRQGRTDAEGAFRVTGLGAGQKHMSVNQSGFVSYSESVTIPMTEPLVITLERSSKVRGRVVADAETVLTRFGLVSMALDSGGRGNSSREVRDATGQFELELGPGRYQLVAMVPGFAPSKSSEFTVVKGEAVEGIEIELARGGRIAGVVVDRSTGAAIESAQVALEPTGRDDQYLSWGSGAPNARSDVEGSFVLEGVPVGMVTLRVSHTGYAQETVSGIAVGADDIATVRIELGGGGTLYGVVRRDGNPVQNARIFVYKQSGTSISVNKQVPTDGEGRYEMQGLPEGQYTVNLRLPGSGRYRNRTATIVDGERTELNIDEAAGIRVSGRIYQGGKPASVGQIMAMSTAGGSMSGNGTIDGSGNYSLEVPGPGKYSLMIQGRGPGENGARVTLNVPAGETEVEFDIELPSGTISGAVVDAATGSPVQRATVIALLPGQAVESFYSLFNSMQSMAQTDGRGQFKIQSVAEGTYSLRVFAEGYADANVQRVRVSRGGADAGEIGLERGISFRVHVRSPDGKPLAGAMTLFRHERGSLVGLRRPASSNTEGVAEIQAVLPGNYRVSVIHTSYAPATLQVRIEPGAEEPTVRLQPGGDLTVQVVDARGDAAGGAEVLLLDASGRNVLEDRVDFRMGPAKGNVVDKRGALSVQHVKPGSYRALASLPDGRRSREVDVEVVRGQTARVDLQFE